MKKKKRLPQPINRVSNGNGNQSSLPVVHLLTREVPLHRAYLGMALVRINEFTDKYPNGDAHGSVLVDWIDYDFHRPDSKILVMVAEREGKLVSHLFGAIMKNDLAGGEQYLNILQWENDPGHGLTRTLEMGVWDLIREWATAHYAQYISLECSDVNLCRRYENQLKFEPRRMLMRYPL